MYRRQPPCVDSLQPNSTTERTGVALCATKAQAEQVKAGLAEWLAPRGLVFNEDKTRIVNLDEGCDFLGFTVRRFGAKLLIRPSKAALRRHRQRLRAEMRLCAAPTR